jgi:hypothetical protein
MTTKVVTKILMRNAVCDVAVHIAAEHALMLICLSRVTNVASLSHKL